MAEDTRTPPKGLAADRRAVLAGAAAIAATAAASKALAQTPPAAAGLGTGGAARAIFKTTDTANGKVMGIANGPVWEFRGIPYGAPTGGRNRYMPPKRPANWAGVRECFAFGQVSPQTQSDIRGRIRPADHVGPPGRRHGRGHAGPQRLDAHDRPRRQEAGVRLVSMAAASPRLRQRAGLRRQEPGLLRRRRSGDDQPPGWPRSAT
jgi:hypothetical protein